MHRDLPTPRPAGDIGDADTTVTQLPNGVRVLTITKPGLATASVSVFVRSGSQHESTRQNGISHLVEHMAFKGTAERSCQQINLDAERRGADVNAHTDKDHTAFHICGLARDAGDFVRMLGDIVCHATFPEAELERERQVILHEYVEDDEDALSTAFKLFDHACWGTHSVAQPVIGNRRNLKRFTRAELLDYVQRQYTGANVIVGVAGDVDPVQIAAAAKKAFGALPRGSDNVIAPPSYCGGSKARRLPGCSETHVVLGFPIPALAGPHQAGMVAAALYGEGMSSPLMDEIREKRGLAYYVACSADVTELCGQFVVEASTSHEQVPELLTEVTRLLAAHTQQVDAVALERARNQISVRQLRTLERPARRLEDAALELYALGRVRSRAERAEAIDAVNADQVRRAFRSMLRAPVSLALAGKVQSSKLGGYEALLAGLRTTA